MCIHVYVCICLFDSLPVCLTNNVRQLILIVSDRLQSTSNPMCLHTSDLVAVLRLK